jgi:chromosome partitioning protein
MASTNGPVVVCVINLKGGVGKSTISALLARRAYVYKNLDVLAIDLDPQANLSQGLMHQGYDKFLEQKRPSIVEIFDGYQPPTASTPSSQPLSSSSGVERLLGDNTRSLELIPSRFDFSDNLVSSVKLDPKNLARFLSKNCQHKDLIVIDCSPTESIFTTAAYHASGKVLVPVRPEYFATIGFPLLQKSLETFRQKNQGHTIDVAGVVINNAFYDGGNDGGPEKAMALREIKTEATKNSWPIYKHQMDHSRGYPKLMRGNNTQIGNAEYFQSFANEFFQSVGL